jgi:nucleotide-binding universal stress UspA family protein
MPRPPDPTLLIDLELPEPLPLPLALVRALDDVRVVLLGWYDVPEQTSPAQARDQFADEAKAALQHAARPFRDAGVDVRLRLVFTGDKLDTVSRIATEEGCDAVYLSGPVNDLQTVLLPLRGTQNMASLAAVVAHLAQGGAMTVTLLHVLEGEEQADRVRDEVLTPVTDALADHGLARHAVSTRLVTSDDPAAAIIDSAPAFDLVVLGETEPSIREILFGTVPERIAHAADRPVVVVRHLRESVEQAERAASS